MQNKYSENMILLLSIIRDKKDVSALLNAGLTYWQIAMLLCEAEVEGLATSFGLGSNLQIYLTEKGKHYVKK